MASQCTSGMAGAELMRKLLNEISDKWTILVLTACDDIEGVRFNEIKRRVGAISPKTLSATLRQLERNGIVERRVIDRSVLAVEYRITSFGRTLSEPLGVLLRWAEMNFFQILASQQSYDGSLAGEAQGRS